ncbi:OmpA family protein [Hymenobacter sp. CRA2]|uniref:OmpA family protein n=1 Tax=Hymenobacter sp. CRA2 TaxID=1955620 RepID=UPI0009900FDD|nr:OmpA family protein [Hymenobacter sp. CRA2]OON69789.1 hypothetical protein B0919_07640 [Hymenobacter sp. CRA2]
MKHPVFSFRLWLALLVGAPLASAAQTADRPTSIGVNLNALQFRGTFADDYWKFDQNKYVFGVAINQYLYKGMDLNAQAFYAELTGTRNSTTKFNTNVVNVNLGLKFKLNNGWLFKESSFIQPYLLAAPGWTYASREGYFDGRRIDDNHSYLDLFGGAGINFRLGGGVGLFVQSGQHLPLGANFDGLPTRDEDNWDDRFLQHTVGLTFNLGQGKDQDQDEVPDRKDRCPNTPPGVPVDDYGCPIDTDKDGVGDYQDECPNDPGTAELQGCPDHDNDGVRDADDACPDVPGAPESKGCPDADKDGVTDAEDKCPDTPAGTTVDFTGCPRDTTSSTVPPASSATADTDNDGVTDAEDRCPTSAGPASNKGCPEIKAETRARLKAATRFIGFELNKAVLLPASYATLDGLAQILRDYPDYSLSIAGHTDNRGPAAFNQRLSRERAAAARSYLVSKGVGEDRVQLRGYGAAHPLTTNTTEAGRAQNRRVEFDLFLTGDQNAAEAKYGPESGAATAPAKAAPAKKAVVKKAPVRKAAPAKKTTSVKRPASAKRTVTRQNTTAKKPAAKRPAAAPAKTPSANRQR